MAQSYFHNSVIEKYKVFISKQDGGSTTNYFHNAYLNTEEGYKSLLAEELHKRVNDTFFGDKNKPTTSAVLSLVLEVLSKCKNLISWQCVDKAKKKIKEALKQNDEGAACIFRSLYCDDDDENSFNKIRAYFGNHFDLVAYFLFSKDHNKYLPIRSSIFDEIFATYAIDAPVLFGNIDWKTYQAYNEIVAGIQEELRSCFNDINISLVDAHSFLWILGEGRFKEFDESKFTADAASAVQREKDHAVIAKARNGQGKYRDDLIVYWGGACSVTGCRQTEILIASHIKPWKDSDIRECVDYFNGLLLTPNLDKLFDKGYISFDDSGAIIISAKIEKSEYANLGISSGMRLSKVEPLHVPYLKYHRENIFNG